MRMHAMSLQSCLPLDSSPGSGYWASSEAAVPSSPASTRSPWELGETLSQVGRLNPAEQVGVEEKTLSHRRTCMWGLGGALGRTQQVEP